LESGVIWVQARDQKDANQKIAHIASELGATCHSGLKGGFKSIAAMWKDPIYPRKTTAKAR
jgi:hypothetical protein